MVIVSQDKDVIVNFDNVENIWINTPLENNDGKFELRAESYSNNMVLGEYETEERAKEILQQIIGKYNEYAKIQNGVGSVASVAILPKIYEMPKE